MPIEFARISSRFSAARKHPILGVVRAHQGVDYAARAGTPIRAAGDGRVAFAGWKGGYGRAVILDHGRGYTTLYGERKSAVWGKNGSVRVDLGGSRIIKKKTKQSRHHDLKTVNYNTRNQLSYNLL